MLMARQGLAAVGAADGKIYAIGGSNLTNVALSSAEVYNPATNSWTQIAALPNGVRGLAAGAATVQGVNRIFTIGGHTQEQPFTAVEVYTP